MLLLLLALLLPTLGRALTCHQCGAGRGPARACPGWRACQGQWCVQQLLGDNLSLFCADVLPPAGFGPDTLSFCHAHHAGGGVVRARCFCRQADFCNAAAPRPRPARAGPVLTLLWLGLAPFFLA